MVADHTQLLLHTEVRCYLGGLGAGAFKVLRTEGRTFNFFKSEDFSLADVLSDET
jgi:hypothetical protein